MKVNWILGSASFYGGKSLRALIIVAALAPLAFGQSIPLSLSATSSGFSISISPSEVVIPPGGTADFTITITGPITSTGVDFSVTGIPPDSTATITMESGSTYLLTITTSRQTPQGQYPFTVTASNGGLSASASAEIIVLLVPS